MSTNQKTQPAGPAARPAKTETKNQQVLLFDKENYMWMIGGVVLVFIGFLLMSGGKSPDPHQFNYEEIYSIRRITIAPIVILLGFAIEVYAIMKKPKDVTAS